MQDGLPELMLSYVLPKSGTETGFGAVTIDVKVKYLESQTAFTEQFECNFGRTRKIC